MHPFRELANHLEQALADGIITTEEATDLLFVVSKYTTVNPYFDQIRAGIQVLMGLLSGYAADARMPESEVQHLHSWVKDWQHLRGLWPYDECEAVVTWIVLNGRIPDEASAILDLAKCVPVSGAEDTEVPALTVAGICAVSPEIEFPGRHFVFTGESARGDRRELAGYVINRDGITSDSVTKKIDYLIVCDAGSPHWAFSCYGRKVEKAFQMRREGHRVLIVHERDFWNALSS